MSVREYIGARYVPIFGRKDETSIAWDDSKPYEPLTIVLYQGNSYTSRQYVPAGIPITNETYWALTGNYNAQVEAYRNEVQGFRTDIDKNTEDIATINGEIGTGFTADNTVRDEITAANGAINDVSKIIGTGFTADNTVRDEITALDDDITNEVGKIEARYKGAYAQPTLVGIVRRDSQRWTGGTLVNRRAQAFCYANGSYYVILAGNDETNASLYSRAVESSQFVYVKEIPVYHASDMIYIPDLQQFWVSTGSDGGIIRFDSAFNVMGQFQIGSSATLLAYDKARKIVYAHDYWGAVYSVDITTLQTTVVINAVMNNAYKQSMAAYNGVVYILFSYPSKILSYDVATGDLINSIAIGDSDIFPIGETEGIDTDNDGNLHITCHIAAPNNSVILAPIYCLSITDDAVFLPIQEWRSNVFVGDRNSLLLAAQTPNGANTAPFATTDEAILALQRRPQVKQIVLIGNHAAEQPQFNDMVNLLGQTEGGAKPILGRVTCNGAFAFIFNINFAPMISVTSFVNGYRNGPISVYQCESSGSHATATTADITSQYPVNKTFVNNVSFS